jgi:putative transposase
LISGVISDLTRSRSNPVLENALLRQQLIVLKRQATRPRLTRRDRFRLVLLARCTGFWKQALHIVQPDTLLRWHRDLFRFYWRRKSQSKPNMPKISLETITLIRNMAEENRLWGAERIHGELLKLGIKVCKRTIQKYMPKERKSPSPCRNWVTFIRKHASDIWACDFTVAYDWLFR